MKYISKQYLDNTVHYFVAWEEAKVMVDAVLKKSYLLTETLKESTRSMVYLIELANQSLILKEPVEKNTSKWIRFTTLMRSSDALQSSVSMLRLQEMGVETNKPLVVVEQRKFGMVVDSWYLCSYVDGDPCSEDDYATVVETLNKIHREGYLHGDAQIRNFLKGKSGMLVIDVKIRRYWNAMQRQLELVYLNNSAVGISQYINEKKISYVIAKFIMNTIQSGFRNFKQKLRKVFNP